MATTLDVELSAPVLDEARQAGLAGAISAFLADEEAITGRIPELGMAARRAVGALDSWTVHEPIDEPTGIVTFTHASIAPADVHRRLLDAGIHTSLIPATRARDMSGPVVRAAFHAYNAEADIARLVTALPST